MLEKNGESSTRSVQRAICEPAILQDLLQRLCLHWPMCKLNAGRACFKRTRANLQGCHELRADEAIESLNQVITGVSGSWAPQTKWAARCPFFTPNKGFLPFGGASLMLALFRTEEVRTFAAEAVCRLGLGRVPVAGEAAGGPAAGGPPHPRRVLPGGPAQSMRRGGSRDRAPGGGNGWLKGAPFL